MALFNPFRPAYVENPYPFLERLRSSEPVHWSPDLRSWVVTRYEDCLRVLQDDEAFSSDPANASGDFGEGVRLRRSQVPLGHAPIMGNSDSTVHQRLRTVVNRAFTPRALEAQRERIESQVAVLLQGAAAGKPFEVVSGLAEQLAVATVLDYLGFRAENMEQVRNWSLAIMRARAEGAAQPGVVEAASQAREEMLGFLAALAESRNDAEAATDVVSVLIEATDEGIMDPDEMLMMLIHISLAGNGPTAMAIANAAFVLATHPEEQRWLREHPEATPAAVEELLRFETPTHFVARFAAQDVKLGSRTIRKGQQVHAMVGAANRDPERFPDPDLLNFERPDNRQLAFGYGVHFCLGAPLARQELDLSVRGLLHAFPTGFEAVDAVRGGSYQVRGFQRLVLR